VKCDIINIYKNNLTPSQSNAGSSYIYYNNSKQATKKCVVYSAVLTLVFVTPEYDPLRSKHVVSKNKCCVDGRNTHCYYE
jgi:hypothetical protein